MTDHTTDGDFRSLAIAAAAQAADATAELLRFAREGDGLHGRFETEPVNQLLDAAKLAMEAEESFDEERGQVYAAICRYLEGWI